MNKNKDFEVLLSITMGLMGLYLIFVEFHFLPALAFAIGVIGLLSSFVRNWIVWSWMKFGQFLGTINGTILLSIVFFVVLFPIALMARAFGKSSFSLDPASEETGYVERNHEYTSEDFENAW
ncbi:MAG TPA: SxtJ family membrane protein [Pyrinomonadaceae bacterium]|nr:SxtJ family membrane protein [Pyrinomonadaceae bacterium]HMP66318.1 SxtJ family membrane protein [Pyrinomonadaceae bacterium]